MKIIAKKLIFSYLKNVELDLSVHGYDIIFGLLCINWRFIISHARNRSHSGWGGCGSNKQKTPTHKDNGQRVRRSPAIGFFCLRVKCTERQRGKVRGRWWVHGNIYYNLSIVCWFQNSMFFLICLIFWIRRNFGNPQMK